MPPQGGQQGGDGNGALWLAAFFIAATVIIWLFFSAQITFAIIKLKAWESYAFNPFTNQFLSLQTEASQLSLYTAKNYTISDLSTISAAVGAYSRYLVFAILGALAALLYFSNNMTKYRNTYSMQRLIHDEQLDWPPITPVVKTDIGKIPLDDQPWAMSLTPMLFAKKYRLLNIETVNPGEDRISTDIRYFAKLKRAQAKQFFFMQLGSYWHGPEALPIYAKALFAMFAAKNSGDKDTVAKFNRQIALSATGNNQQLNFNGVDALLAKYKDSKAVQHVCSKHAFNYTVMAAMLEFARQDGVYATADFLWLKPLDRRLWYTLNTVGRATAFAEVAGIHAHFRTEKLFGRKIPTPVVDAAVVALEIALDEVIYKADAPVE